METMGNEFPGNDLCRQHRPNQSVRKGGYIQLRKKLFDDFLLLQELSGMTIKPILMARWTPRITAVIRVAKDNNIRLHFKQLIAFPSNQDQYIDLNTGSVIISWSLPEFLNRYG